MKTNPIGHTNVRVTDLCFGCSGLGNLYREVSDADSNAVLQSAWDNGIRYFDTAPHYGRGLSEQRLGAFVKGKIRDDFVVSTKVGRLLSPGPQLSEADGFIHPLPMKVRYDYTGDGIEASFEQSCERLGLSRIDIIYVHDIGRYTHGHDNTKHFADLINSGIPRLRHLKERGRIGAYGLGVNENEVCLETTAATDIDVILIAGRLTLLDRSAEKQLVDQTWEKGISLVAGGIFNSGILATGAVPGAHFDYGPPSDEIIREVNKLEARCTAFGVTLPQAALQFAIKHPSASSVIIGTAKVSSLERNLELAKAPWPAPADELLTSKIG